MRFLSPGFLFALLAIAIPIIIHLFNFRKYKKVYFSNVRFLKEIQVQSSARQHLKDRLILASRILALMFLVLAFARPYVPAKDTKGSFERQAVSVFIDNSYSMEAVNKEGTLLDEAKRRSIEIAAAHGVNDKFQLLTNDFAGRDQRLLSRDEFLNAVEEVRISSAGRDLGEILSRQEEIFSSEPNSRKSIYVISDFQNNLLPEKNVKADTGLHIRLVRLKATAQPNISIDSVWFLSAIHKPNESERLVVKLRNNSGERAENIPIRLNINKQQKALGSLSIEPRATSSDTLSFSGLSAGWQQGELEISDFPVIFDDKFYFSFNVERSLSVLVINGAEESRYINAVYRSDPYFQLQNAAAGNINYTGLNSYPMVILNQVYDFSGGLTEQLSAYVRQGGSLMVFPDHRQDLTSLRTFLQNFRIDVPESVETVETKVNSINLQHPIFKGVFDQLSPRMDLPVAKVFIRFSNLNTNRQSIMELPGRRLFFSQFQFGNGKVYLSAVPLNDETSNFARHSVFVPIMYQSALLAVRVQDLYHKLSAEQMVQVPKITLNSGQTLKLKGEKFEVIPDLRQNENLSQIYIADQIRQSGNYQLMKNDSLLAVLSFNESGDESDMSYASDKEIAARLDGGKVKLISPDRDSLQNEITSIERGFSLWKLCIVLALIFLAAEIFLIRFFKRKSNTNPGLEAVLN